MYRLKSRRRKQPPPWGRAVGLLVALFIVGVAGVATAGTRVEVTFDDEDDGAGPQNGHAMVDNLENNFSSLGQGYIAVELTGSARRSAFQEGWYGRAADFPDGQGAIELHDFDLTDRPVTAIGMWVRALDVSAGRLFYVQDTAAVSLLNGELVVELWDALGGVTVEPMAMSWPGDGAFHYLQIVVSSNNGPTLVELTLDFQLQAQLELLIQLPPADAAVTLAEGFVGLIDELLVLSHLPGVGDRWDVDPNAECPQGLNCLEEVIDLVPSGFSHRVPLRMKSMVDAAACSSDSPCPLLLIVSGGGTCANNYAGQGQVEYYARDGFVAVTVDPYCEGDKEFKLFPMETSQLVAAKNHLMSSSPLATLIDGPNYAATGCSHGCGSVTQLMMFEQDYPQRTFGNSCSLDWILCAYEGGVLCPATVDYLEQRVIDEIGSLDWENPLARQSYGRSGVSMLTPDTVATREFAAAWGRSVDGNVCTLDGRSDCYEESMWGMTYSSRRIRDLWQRLEPSDAPTGYFVENHEADCKHCASVGSPAFECGSCLLKHGRLGMEQACPQCLSYADPSISTGAEASDCPIEASWYVDPLRGLAKDKQGCVNAMNKSGARVSEAQSKDNERCLRDYQRGRLTMSFEGCTGADRKGKVQRAEEKTVRNEAKRCTPLALPPAFAYSDSATVNQAAAAGAMALTHQIFGDPVDDADLFTNAANKDAAKCQTEMLKRADKLEGTVLSEINKTKKRALRGAVANSASALESTVAAVFSANTKIDKAEDRLARKVDKSCAALGTAPVTIFPGACAGPTLLEIEDCVIAAARCQACLKLSAFDALNLDCDQADDQIANGSCP